jgi:hypothetical protein
VSTTRYSRDGLSITTFAGPQGCNEHTGGRACVQITSHSLNSGDYQQWVCMNMDHWVDLVCLIRRMDEEGHSILSLSEADDD